MVFRKEHVKRCLYLFLGWFIFVFKTELGLKAKIERDTTTIQSFLCEISTSFACKLFEANRFLLVYSRFSVLNNINTFPRNVKHYHE